MWQAWSEYQLFLSAATDSGLRSNFEAACKSLAPSSWLDVALQSMTPDGEPTGSSASQGLWPLGQPPKNYWCLHSMGHSLFCTFPESLVLAREDLKAKRLPCCVNYWRLAMTLSCYQALLSPSAEEVTPPVPPLQAPAAFLVSAC